MKHLLLTCAILFQLACSGEAEPEVLATKAPVDYAWRYEEVKPGIARELLSLPAVVSVHPSGLTQLTPPYAGQVRQLLVREGQRVTPDTVVALLHLPELSANAGLGPSLKSSVNARSERLALERAKLEVGVGTREAVSEALAATADAELALATWQGNQAAAHESGLKPVNGVYQWLAGRSGIVCQLQISTGQSLGPGQPALVLMDSQHLEVQVQVPERFLAELGAQPRLRWRAVGANNDQVLDYERRAVAIDPHSHTLAVYFKVRLELTQSEGFLPGRAGQGTLLVDDPELVSSIPRSALCRIDNSDGVFVAPPDGAEPTWVKITVLGSSGDQLLVQSAALKPGTRVVTHGVFRLKSKILMARES